MHPSQESSGTICHICSRFKPTTCNCTILCGVDGQQAHDGNEVNADAGRESACPRQQEANNGTIQCL